MLLDEGPLDADEISMKMCCFCVLVAFNWGFYRGYSSGTTEDLSNPRSLSSSSKFDEKVLGLR